MIDLSETPPYDIQTAINAGMTLCEPKIIEGTHFVMVPPNCKVESLEHLQLHPSRTRGRTILRDASSFIKMVEREITPATSIYGNHNPPGFVAVFNDHSKNGAGWRDHTAVFNCPLSVEWTTWKAGDGKSMTQEQFAKFIEDNLPDIANPPAADMLEISRSLEAKKRVNFASGVRLSNGQTELTYEEEISGTAAKGKLQVPELFTIGIEVLEGGPRYGVDARLRYRIQDGGKLSIWYDLVRPHKVQEDAVKEVWQEIAEKTCHTILNGSI